MSENKKRGRPVGSTKFGYTTGRFSLTEKEMAELEKRHERFKKEKGLEKLSKSEFIRMLIVQGLKVIK